MVPQEFLQLLFSTALNRLDHDGPFATHVQHHLHLPVSQPTHSLEDSHAQKQQIGRAHV